MTAAERARRRRLVERARATLSELPTASLYRIHALLERALARGDVPADTYAELERAFRPKTRRSKGKGL